MASATVKLKMIKHRKHAKQGSRRKYELRVAQTKLLQETARLLGLPEKTEDKKDKKEKKTWQK